VLARHFNLLPWKQAAAAEMCSYVLGELGDGGVVQAWLESLQDQEWVEAALSPFISTLVLDQTVEWPQRYAVDESVRLLRTPTEGRYPWGEVPLELVPILRRMGIGSRRLGCEEADFILPGHSEWQSYGTLLRGALLLLDAVAPRYLEELHTASSAVVLVNEMASFRGASGASQRGLIFLSPTPDWDEIVFAEELIHETTHCILDLISISSPLFTAASAYEEKYHAPFRPDLRAWYGNFHAVVVCARCITFYRMLMESRSDQSKRCADRVADLQSKAGPVSAELLSAPMSEVGRNIFESWVVSEFREWLS